MIQTDFLKRRVETRELLMRLFYQMGITNDYSEDAKTKFLDEYVLSDNSIQPDYKYFNRMLKAFISNRENVDKCISGASDNWKLERISKVDFAILRLSVTEMQYLEKEDISEKISINEAVELAKNYGTEKSPGFINGLLGRIAREEADNGTKTD